MSAPRWTLGEAYSGGRKRLIYRDHEPVFFMSAVAIAVSPELTILARRIVSLLNATELTSDAMATLQYATMSTAAYERSLTELTTPHSDPEDVQRIATLDAMTDTLNHTVRLYAELDEEPSLKLEEVK